jgi:hypothetical protein
MDTPKRIGLAELIAQVREEIEEAQEKLRASGKQAMIDWESAEIVISFGVTKGGNAKGSANIHIFAIEAGGEYKSEEVHRLTLRLKPHDDSPISFNGTGIDWSKAVASRAVASIPKSPGSEETIL